jgi:hypothetical protein
MNLLLVLLPIMNFSTNFNINIDIIDIVSMTDIIHIDITDMTDIVGIADINIICIIISSMISIIYTSIPSIIPFMVFGLLIADVRFEVPVIKVTPIMVMIISINMNTISIITTTEITLLNFVATDAVVISAVSCIINFDDIATAFVMDIHAASITAIFAMSDTVGNLPHCCLCTPYRKVGGIIGLSVDVLEYIHIFLALYTYTIISTNANILIFICILSEIAATAVRFHRINGLRLLLELL